MQALSAKVAASTMPAPLQAGAASKVELPAKAPVGDRLSLSGIAEAGPKAGEPWGPRWSKKLETPTMFVGFLAMGLAPLSLTAALGATLFGATGFALGAAALAVSLVGGTFALAGLASWLDKQGR